MKNLLAGACVLLLGTSVASADPALVYSPVTALPTAVTTYYQAPYVAAYPAYVTTYYAAPTVAYYAGPTITYYPTAAVPAPYCGPVVYGRRVLVHPKVYVAGQPVRNLVRAVTP